MRAGEYARASEEEEEAAEQEEEAEPTADARHFVADLLSYAVGCALGRWDVRFATGEGLPRNSPTRSPRCRSARPAC